MLHNAAQFEVRNGETSFHLSTTTTMFAISEATIGIGEPFGDVSANSRAFHCLWLSPQRF